MSDCTITSVGLIPLTEVGGGGIYPGRVNNMPAAHSAAGVDQASLVKPRKDTGQVHHNGKIVLLSLGASTATMPFSTFKAMNPSPNPKVVLVDGAQAGQTTGRWADPAGPCWDVLADRLVLAGVTAAQVQAVWFELSNEGGEWSETVDAADVVLRALVVRFPNLRLVYLSSRIYGGYADSPVEPTPYNTAFAVRGIIERQLNGALPFDGTARVAPWVMWAPYLWADGLTPRTNGLFWECSDFNDDGVHPNMQGRTKIANRLKTFFLNHVTTQPWFVGA
jgi:hypothetical protein